MARNFLNCSVRYEIGKRPIQGGIELFSSNLDIEAMGRPRKFSREGVLQKALPVFWKYGFARTTLPELEQATGVNTPSSKARTRSSWLA
jgi:hypothetical protein